MLDLKDLEYTEQDVDSFLVKMHMNGALSVLSTALAIYLIIWKSPKAMGAYKWFLLNIVVSIFWFELFIIVIFTPFPIFPNPGFCAIGPLKQFGWYWGSTVPFFVLTLFLGICGMSVNLAAAFRLSAIYGVSQTLIKPFYSGLLLLCQMVYAAPTLIAGLMSVQDREKSVAGMLQTYPKMEKFFMSHTCFVIPLDDNPKMYICLGVALIQLVVVEIMSAMIIYLSFKSLIKRKCFMSAKVYNMHMQFIWSIGAQFAVPIITINTPFLLYCIFLISQSPAGVDFSPYLFIGVTTHSFFNTLIMISMTAPYRDTVISWIRIRRVGKVPVVPPISVTLVNLDKRATIVK
ncbi:hypothetical protein FO519_000578 [Halicephalobus sp. NKZ332]|nr:hypothetical protein FO519_000578 [Halicephalobus sp. NKZ332]